jgi:hypothetical protein
VIVVIWTGGPVYELTTAGIHRQSEFGSLFIPWEALYADGPSRPTAAAINASQLQLAAVRPELVRYRGIVRARSPEWPVLPLATTTHPWLLADAIRWYAEHPEHRAGIGTQEEHDRLISTVTGDYPQLDERLRPPRPRQVTAAVWIGVAGAFASVVLVAAILYIVGAFQGRMAEVFGPIAAAAWCGLVLVGTVLTLLAARGIRRASQRARVGMMVLSGLAALAGTFASPSRWLFDVPSELPHGMIVITLWVAYQSLVLATCAAVIVLLLLPPSSRYFKPPFRRGPELV